MPGATAASSKYCCPPAVVPIGVKPNPQPSVFRRTRYSVAPGEEVQESWTGAFWAQEERTGALTGWGHPVGWLEGSSALPHAMACRSKAEKMIPA